MNVVEIAAIATVVSMFIGGGISYGMTKGVLNGLKERVKNLEQSRYLTREEYEARHAELHDLIKRFIQK